MSALEAVTRRAEPALGSRFQPSLLTACRAHLPTHAPAAPPHTPPPSVLLPPPPAPPNPTTTLTRRATVMPTGRATTASTPPATASATSRYRSPSSVSQLSLGLSCASPAA